MTNEASVTVDGQAVQVPKGITVVLAASELGIEIPVFCYHPKMRSVGMCRMCLVEIGTPQRGEDGEIQRDEGGQPVINWMPKLQTGCTMQVSDGMVVRTQTDRVEGARRSVIEFLLTSHPLDCPVCDKGGECPLQDLTMSYGPGKSRFRYDEKFHFEKPIRLSDPIWLDRERCIQCGRCTRFCDDLAGDPVLGFEDRGRGMQIVTYSDPPFDSKFSGNTTDICPVGALTSADFRFKARAWETDDVASVCPHCSVGCNLGLGMRSNSIRRILPRHNEAVNEVWMCDKGRFAHHFVRSEDRLTEPLVRRDGELKPASWPKALDLVADRLRAIRDEAGAEAVGGVSGDRCANEDLYLFQKLFRTVFATNNVDHRPKPLGGDGAALVAELGVATGTNLGDMSSGDALLVLGADPEEEQPVHLLRLRVASKRGAHLIVANGRPTKLDVASGTTARYRYGTETQFVLGLMHVILEEGWEDADFIADRTEGLEQLRDAVASYDPATVADVTGVSQEVLRQVARSFAEAENGIILVGREAFAAVDQQELLRALANLALVTGHVGRPNNGLLALLPHNNSQGALDMGLLPDRLPGFVPVGDPALGDHLGRIWGSPPPEVAGLDFAGMLDAARDGRLKALYALGTDPVGDDPSVREAFDALDFLVVQELFLTDTAQMADVVLPAQAWAEREGTFTNTERRIQLFRRGVQAPGESRPDWEIVSEVGRRAGGSGWDYDSTAVVEYETSRAVPIYNGVTYRELRVALHRTRSHFVLYGTSWETRNDREGVQWPAGAEDETARYSLQKVEPPAPPSDGDYPFVLVARKLLYDDGTLLKPSKELVRPWTPDPHLALDSEDAERLGVKGGEVVRIVSPHGQAEFPARVDEAAPSGVVLAPANLDGVAMTALLGPEGAITRARIEKGV